MHVIHTGINQKLPSNCKCQVHVRMSELLETSDGMVVQYVMVGKMRESVLK